MRNTSEIDISDMGVMLTIALAARRAGKRSTKTYLEPTKSFSDILQEEGWRRQTYDKIRWGKEEQSDKYYQAAIGILTNLGDAENTLAQAIALLKTAACYEASYQQVSKLKKTRYEIRFNFGSIIVNETDNYILLSKSPFHNIIEYNPSGVLSFMKKQLRKTNRRLP